MSAPRFAAKMGALPRRKLYALSRVYPRLTVGGAEADILTLLEGIGDTQMIVTEVEGAAAAVAKERARGYVHLQAPRFFNLWTALQCSPVVHLHTINDHPLAPLAAQFADAKAIIQTVHNDFDSEASHFADHSIVVAEQTKWRLAAPNRCTTISSGIAVPPEVPPRTPLTGRPVRLLEVRRPDKPMALTLEQIVRTGLLDHVAWTATVVGMDAPTQHDPRITYAGAVSDVSPFLREADVLVHASATETFGRAVFEALAFGAHVLATPLPPFVAASRSGASLRFISTPEPQAAARDLLLALADLHDETMASSHRARNHAFVKQHHGTQLMIARTRETYRQCQDIAAPPRNFVSKDVTDGDTVVFAAALDALMERKTPPSIHAGLLSSRQQAVLMWLGLRFGVIRPSVAIPVLENAAKVLGPRHLLCMDLANAHAKLGQLPQALAWSTRAVELDPQKIGSFIACALLQSALKQQSRASDWLARIQTNWPAHPDLAQLAQRVAAA